ncbi:MAG: polysaccharide biosynthesis protein, partial [Anaerolineae bacterium]|nr:polysaccharide biosynthesis protein [Anaerolineae bacterium]
IIDWLLSVVCVGGIRFSVRYLGEFGPLKADNGLQGQGKRTQRVLIAGAGEAGAMIAREMRANPGVGMEPVGFVDDNQAKLGMQLRGLPVLGTRASIPELVRAHEVDQVLIAMPTAPGQAIRAIREICRSTPVPVKTIPGVYELLSGRVQVSQIRDVQIEDLLRRDPVRAEDGDAPYLRDKVVLVTGAGGSIGSELCRQIAHRRAGQVVLLGHGENSIYHIYREMRVRFPEASLAPVIADIRDAARLERVFAHYRPEIVFHAAAHKHVPLVELNAEEGVTNNVLGTRTVLEAAERSGAARLVLVSSDKAVEPCNLMGATKRIAELMVQDAARRTDRNYVVVRFGNVLGSRGSVVPLFQEQIAAGGPVTVTHPDMERYFMTIPEAVYLVLQASGQGTGGELFVLDMGEPVKIVDLARDLITLSGLEPDRDIEIRFTGIRPGEKLSERLLADGEDYAPTRHDKVFICQARPSLDGEALRQGVQQVIDLAQQGGSSDAIWAAVRAVVPECTSSRAPAMPDSSARRRVGRLNTDS